VKSKNSLKQKRKQPFMTFEELESRYGKQDHADWHQHKNGGAWVYKSASISEDVFVGERALVWGGTIEGGTIEGGTIEGGTIRGGTWQNTPLFIAGSKFELSNSEPGHIAIGCQCHPFEWWEGKEAMALAKSHGFTKEQIKEYRAYIKLFKTFGK
jgi:hypothetical protein